MNSKHVLLITFLFMIINFNLSASLFFEHASLKSREYLINFSIESNDTYKTRTAPRNITKKVFDLSEEAFINSMVFTLKYNDTIVGFFALNAKNADKCELTHLFVKAGLQNEGYGSRLFAKSIEISKSLGFTKLFWISDPDAAYFYLKKGAKIVGYDENILNPKVNVPLFEYDLLDSK